jgi:hypothetical protein
MGTQANAYTPEKMARIEQRRKLALRHGTKGKPRPGEVARLEAAVADIVAVWVRAMLCGWPQNRRAEGAVLLAVIEDGAEQLERTLRQGLPSNGLDAEPAVAAAGWDRP